jgi:WD40 repeat protein
VLKWAKRRPVPAALYAFSAFLVVLLLGLGFWFSAEMGAARGNLKAEEARRAAAELAREAEAAGARAARQLADAQHLFGLHRAAEQRSTRAEPGWTWANLADLENAARLAPAPAELVELRSEAAAALGSIDIRLCGRVGKDFNADCLAFHPGGRLLALGQAKCWPPIPCQVRLTDVSGKEKDRSVSFQPGILWEKGRPVQDGVRALAFSPDGRWLAAGSRSGMLHLWDLTQKTPTPISWPALKTRVFHLLFSRDGTALFAASDSENVVQRWTVPTESPPQASKIPERVYRASPDQAHIRALAMHPSEGWLVCAPIGDTLHFLSDHSLQPLRAPLHRLAERMRFSPDGRCLIVGTNTRLELVNGENGEVLRSYLHGGEENSKAGSIDALAVSPDGVLLARSSRETKHLRLWERPGGRLLADLFVGDGTLRTAFSPDGRLLAVPGDHQTLLYEVGGGSVQTFMAGQPRPIVACALQPDGRSLATLSRSSWTGPWHDVTVWPTGKEAGPIIRHTGAAILHGNTVPALAFQPGSRVLAHNSEKGVALGDGLGLTQRQEVLRANLEALSFGPDGALWGVGGEELYIHDGRTGTQRTAWKNELSGYLTGKSNLYVVAVGRQWAAVGARDGAVHLFDAAGTRKSGIAACRAAVRSVALFDGDRLLAVGSDGGELGIFRVPTGDEIVRLTPHRDRVTAVAGYGRLLVSGSRDGVLKLWRVEPEGVSELLTLKQPAGVRWLGLHPDGVRLFVLLEGESAVRVWHLDRLRSRLTEVGFASGLEVLEPRVLPPEAPKPVVAPAVTEPPRGPNGLKTELFADPDLRRCVKVRYDQNIDFDWGLGSPDPLVPPERFSIRWSGWLRAPRPGRYTLQLESDDGARLWLDEKLLVDCSRLAIEQLRHAVEVELDDRPHSLRVEYFQANGGAHVRLTWAQADRFPMRPVEAACLFHDRATAE